MSLGDLYNEAGQPEKSAEAYAKVGELDPKNAYKTFFNLGALIENREDISEADNRKAIEAFRKAIEIKPDYAIAHKHLAFLPAAPGGHERGEAVLPALPLELDPRAADAGEIRGVQ